MSRVSRRASSSFVSLRLLYLIFVLCVPTTSSTSCDQPIFVDHATDVSVFSDAVQVEIDWLG